VMFACFLPVLLMFVALVVDVGAAFLMKRHLQSAVDAAALAAAQELPNTVDAEGVANEYSASDGGRNVRTSLPVVTTVVSFPEPFGQKVKVTASAKSPLFFAGLFGFEGFDVSATAVASKTSETTGTPLAVYVHELCGASTGNKGFIAAGENMRIEGGIHSNGQFTVGNAGLRSVGPATVYRPTAGSPPGPAQGSCAGTAPLHIQDQSDSSYCTGCPGGALDEPQPALWRDWTTPYHTEDIMKGYTPCTFNHPGDMKYENTTIPSGVHCLPNNKKFTIVGTSSGNITVIGGIIEVGGTGTLEPYNSNHPVLFYSTNTVSSRRPGCSRRSGFTSTARASRCSGRLPVRRRAASSVPSGSTSSPREEKSDRRRLGACSQENEPKWLLARCVGLTGGGGGIRTHEAAHAA
jgi:hypothetical protein